MRLDLMEILVCAICRGDLDLKIQLRKRTRSSKAR